MDAKRFVQPDELRVMSFELANKIGWAPDFMVALWRGGASIGMYVHEFLERKFNRSVDHIAIRTSRYTGIEQANEQVKVEGLEHIYERVRAGQTVLIVDDVWDAGTTMKAVMDKLEVLKVTVEVAVMFYKPKRNTIRGAEPKYFVESTDRWLVFPHELEGLTDEEICTHYGERVAKMCNEQRIPPQ